METLVRVGQGGSPAIVSHSAEWKGERTVERHVKSMEDSRSLRTRSLRAPRAVGLDIESGILRAEVDLEMGPDDLKLWCGKAKQGKVQGQLQLFHMPANTEDGDSSHRQSPGVRTQRERGCESVWCTFPCQHLRTSFGLPTVESLVKWGKEIDYEG